jgi:hypothetical protein
MGYDIRLPNITGSTEKEQLKQIRSYLHQFVEQMQWVLNDISMNQGGTTTIHGSQQASASQADGEKDGVATFDSIKALIIKSADIVDAYYEEINRRLDGVYAAKSEFGSYEELKSQVITETSSYTDYVFDTHQKIVGNDIKGINDQLREVKANIKLGELYRDESGFPVHGVEIGETRNEEGKETFKKFARFTADRLSFYDQNGYELAYISDYKLYIRNVEITSTFKIGGFIDTVMANGNVVTKWVGGEG